MPATLGEFTATDGRVFETLTVYNEKGTRLCFGEAKAKLLVANMDAIKAFAEKNDLDTE
jgi:hypothetical protein